MALVTVSIVNHESGNDVLEALASIERERAASLELEVIVVDNASGDGSVEAIRSRFQHVVVVAREQRHGYGANHNVALRRARGDHVLLLNADVVIQPGAIESLSRHLDEHPKTAVAAPTVLAPDHRLEPTLWPSPSPFVELRTLLRGGAPRPVRDGEVIGWAQGCALMVRRASVLDVGGFDEGFFMYCEEIDLCTRLVNAGHRIVHANDATVIHRGGGSTGPHPSERAVEVARSRRRYWHKHQGLAARSMSRGVVGAQLTGLAVVAAARGRPVRARLIEAAMCFYDPGWPGLRERADAYNRASALRRRRDA